MGSGAHRESQGSFVFHTLLCILDLRLVPTMKLSLLRFLAPTRRHSEIFLKFQYKWSNYPTWIDS